MDICTPMFKAALLTVAEMWSNPVSVNAGPEKRGGTYIQ